MDSIFIGFIGHSDLCALGMKEKDRKSSSKGPTVFILQKIVRKENIKKAIILNDFNEISDTILKNKLEANVKNVEFQIINAHSIDPGFAANNHEKIHALIDAVCKNLNADHFHINLAAGTPAMISMLLLYAKTQLNASYYKTFFSKETKKDVLELVDIPFEISFKKIGKTYEKSIQEISSKVGIIGQTEKLKEAIKKAHKVADYDVSCFIFGETGTGKELIAKEIATHSQREKYKTLNCSFLSNELARSELFGYKKGAFTGASSDYNGLLKQCHNGILFLDEVGDLSLQVQTKLLRFIQEGEFTPLNSSKTDKSDVKIIAATHKDIYEMIQQGTFREDLFYRLAIEVIEIPSLRERKEDIPLLAKHFMDIANQEFSTKKHLSYVEKKFSDSAINVLTQNPWKGNIRELQHTITRIAMWTNSEIITKQDVQRGFMKSVIKEQQVLIPDFPVQLKEYLKTQEKTIIEAALKQTNYKQNKAAALLKVKTDTLNKAMKRLNIII